jgi:probable F420-dependent oxidoreductase
MELTGVGVWDAQLRFGDPAEAAEAAVELEELGYHALWIPDVGGPVFDAVGQLLQATRQIPIATGILNLWMHSPTDVAAGYAALTAAHGDRFLLGIGVSHAPLVDSITEPGRFSKPMAATAAFLDGLDAADPPVPVDHRVLAALGPKMLDLAAKRSGGVHPYLVTPEHTRLARETLGAGSLVLPEQTVILCSGRDEARAIGAPWLQHSLNLPNYVNNMLRLGFTADDVSTISDRLFDALIVWGDEAAIKHRVDEHLAAGADHVCIQALIRDPRGFPREHWRRLAPALV